MTTKTLIAMDPKPFILFADDEPATLEAYGAFVDDFDWRAEFVADADELVRRVMTNQTAGKQPFDAIVCDIGTPTGTPSNVAAVRALRAAFPDLPVVFVTSYSGYWIKDEIRNVRAELFTKPADLELLFERLSYLVKWHRSTMPPPELVERRRKAVNETDYRRRRTDREIEIPLSVRAAAADVRELRPGH